MSDFRPKCTKFDFRLKGLLLTSEWREGRGKGKGNGRGWEGEGTQIFWPRTGPEVGQCPRGTPAAPELLFQNTLCRKS